MDPVYVLFGTESGNTQGLAKRAADALEKAGLTAKVVDMMDLDVKNLPKLRKLLVITSTYGNGDPPSNAEQLHAYLMRKAPQLPDLAFSVCGLGDTTYDRFAQCGKDFDKRLGELGATRVLDRQDCDVDYDDPFEAWLEEAVAAMSRLNEAEASAPSTAAAPEAPPTTLPPPPVAHDPPGTRRNPVVGTLLESALLTGPGSTKKARHVVLRTAGTGLTFEVGDSIGVWPVNDPALVDAVIHATKVARGAPVKVGHVEAPIEVALAEHLDLVVPDVRLAERCLGPLDADARKQALATSHVIDLLSRHGAPFSADDLANLLRPMVPRPYSVANSPLEHPGEVHLLVDVVEYTMHGTLRKGVASSYLGERRAIGDGVRAYCHASPHFRLPAPDVSIVMIGPGTGVAPYRGFLEERLHRRGKGSAWLFFGARNRASDFYYEADWQRFQAAGVLQRVDTAFSRDQASKVYVQHRMREHARDLYGLVTSGAVFYVCGDAHHMAPDVHAALVDIVAGEGAVSVERAREIVEEMAASGRYQRDVY